MWIFLYFTFFFGGFIFIEHAINLLQRDIATTIYKALKMYFLFLILILIIILLINAVVII